MDRCTHLNILHALGLIGDGREQAILSLTGSMAKRRESEIDLLFRFRRFIV
jgi:hypothetical protein